VKATIGRADLAGITGWAARVLAARPAIPVLAGIEITADDDHLTARGTDYDEWASATAPARIGEPGTIVVPGRLFTEISKLLPDKPVELTADDAMATVTCGPCTYKLHLIPHDDYPAIPDTPVTAGTIPAAALSEALGAVLPAVSRTGGGTPLDGVHIESDGTTLQLCATDKYRAAAFKTPWTPVHKDDVKVTVNADKLSALTRAAVEIGDMAICFSAMEGGGAGLIGFTVAGRSLAVRLIGGDYPSVSRLFPAEFTRQATVDTEVLADAVKRATTVLGQHEPVILTVTQGEMLLAAGWESGAGFRESFPCELEGGDWSTGYKPQYLLDGLIATRAARVKIGWTAERRPCLITPAEETQPGFQYLLMPLIPGRN